MKKVDQSYLLETICWEDGVAPLLDYHQARVDEARQQLFGIKRRLNLGNFLAEQSLPDRGKHKLRLLYAQEIKEFTCQAYQARSVECLRLVETDGLDYRYKWADRHQLEDVYARREGCDDVIILWRGYLTDTSYANLILNDGHYWWTPAHPLLKGVRRGKLIEEGKIRTALIRAADLNLFKEVKLINALLNVKDTKAIPVANIYAPGRPV